MGKTVKERTDPVNERLKARGILDVKTERMSVDHM